MTTDIYTRCPISVDRGRDSMEECARPAYVARQIGDNTDGAIVTVCDIHREAGEAAPLWAREFDLSYDVPRAIYDAGLMDTSWHNDACPSFSAMDDDVTVTLWVEHPKRLERDTGSEKRFAVTLYTLDEDRIEYCVTDDVDEAIAKYREAVEEYEVGVE